MNINEYMDLESLNAFDNNVELDEWEECLSGRYAGIVG